MTLLAIAAIGLTVFAVLMYNSLINRKNRVERAYSTVDVMLRRRLDLIPNLVRAVQASMDHERNLMATVTELRTQALVPSLEPEQRFQLENDISKNLSRLRITVEAYPDLKASQNVLQLQAALNEAEEQIAAARRTYNACVYEYNNGVEMLPMNLMAALMRYRKKPSFELPEGERASVNAWKHPPPSKRQADPT